MDNMHCVVQENNYPYPLPPTEGTFALDPSTPLKFWCSLIGETLFPLKLELSFNCWKNLFVQVVNCMQYNQLLLKLASPVVCYTAVFSVVEEHYVTTLKMDV